jgi:hypothetical protein
MTNNPAQSYTKEHCQAIRSVEHKILYLFNWPNTFDIEWDVILQKPKQKKTYKWSSILLLW